MSDLNSSATLLEEKPSKEGTPLARATDPEATVWVSANAGSGKTFVLSRRVIRLLLEGAKPSELLCLTFTKVAAAEMSNRVFSILGDWVQLDDVALSAAISDLTGKAAGRVQLKRARELFATALDTPGGLRVQTIHAFCESLLHQFPLEANIPGHFEMMNETDQALLLDEARRRVILAGLGMGHSGSREADVGGDLEDDSKEPFHQRLAKAYETLRDHAGDAGIEKALIQLVHNRDKFTRWVEDGGGAIALAFAPVWQAFNLSHEMREQDLYRSFEHQTAYDAPARQRLADALRVNGSSTAGKLLGQLEELASSDDPESVFAIRRAIFLTAKDEPRKSLVSNSFMDKFSLQPTFGQEQDILLAQLDRIKTLHVLKASEALYEIAWAMLSEYGNLKQQRGLLDFSDLISKTLNLLSRSEIASWVQYKLDAGIRHLLVDEAQDTSPVQWEIIRLIAEEFYSGVGAREGTRTLFVVGDEKQSIFSFQGADPAEFARQFRDIMKKVDDSGGSSDTVPLNTSFRSTDDVLSAVDKVFALPENRRGLSSQDIPPSHTANRMGQPGDVYVWPLEIRQKDEPRDKWNDPVDKGGSKAAERRLANRIADTIHGWIKAGEKLPAHNTPIQQGDILILVRKRDRFVKAMNMALKERGLKSAGADRLKLTEHIAVEDMIALGRFAVNPSDDLSLAGLLKSPVFDFDEDCLMQVAMKRDGVSLFQSIATRSRGDKSLETVLAKLEEIVAEADRVPVHEFYAEIFSRYRLRARYLERLGNEVEDILDGFFQTLIDYDKSGGLGLLDFVEWLASAAPELKREIELESDEIRIITTHSAKGLEKPIVFLVDPGSEAFSPQHIPAIVDTEQQDGLKFPLWQSQKAWHIKACEPALEEIRIKAEEEYRRLLYVGMTRAADRLIICGYGKEDISYPHWHSMVLDGLMAENSHEPATRHQQGRLAEVRSADGELIYHKWQIPQDNPRKIDTKPVGNDSKTNLVIPDWTGPARKEAPAPRPLSPSGVLAMLDIMPENEVVVTSNNSNALLKGNLTHQLLQALPDIRADERTGFAKNWIDHHAGREDKVLREAILDGVFRVLSSPDLEPLFGPSSRGEVEIAGTLDLGGQARKVNGKIDRLLVSDSEIIVADYKTNVSVPNSPEAVPEQYLAQMALYRQLLNQIYPNRPINALLVWTQDASAMHLPPELLDRQIERLNKP